MTLIRRRTPFRELMGLPQVMDRLMEETFNRPFHWMPFSEPLVPALDVRSAADEVIVEAALPGVKPENVEITLDGDLLTIKGSFKEEIEKGDEGYTYRELNRGEFSRTITLPVTAKPEEAKAVFKHGLLTLTIPKTEATKPHHVKIESI